MKVVCIKTDRSETRCSFTGKTIDPIPVPKKGDIVTVRVPRILFDELCYSFEEYDEDYWYEAKYYRPLQEIQQENLKTEIIRIEEEMTKEYIEIFN